MIPYLTNTQVLRAPDCGKYFFKLVRENDILDKYEKSITIFGWSRGDGDWGGESGRGTLGPPDAHDG